MVSFSKLALTSLMAGLLAACGGGGASSDASGQSASTSTVTPAQAAVAAASAPTPVLASAPVAAAATPRAAPPADETKSYFDSGALAAGASGTTAASPAQTLSASHAQLAGESGSDLTYSFDAPFFPLASGWLVNWWGSTAPKYAASQDTRSAYVFGGTGSQHFRLDAVAADGDAQLVYLHSFAKGTKYTISINVRSDVAASVRFQFRQSGAPYSEVSSKTVDVGPAWQRVELAGVYAWSDVGSFRAIPMTLGADIYLDEMTIAATASDAPAVAGGIDLPAQGGSAVTLTTLKFYDMEGDFYNGFAAGWFFNAYNGSSEGTLAVARETRTDHVHAGASSQRFQVTDKKGGAVDLISQYPFVQGKTYHASFWMRADEPTPVQAYMRMDAAPWQPFGSVTVTLNTTWQKIDIEGAYISDAIGSLRVALVNATGTVWIDDVTISEVNKNDLAPFTADAIPDTMFGMHVNQLGVHNKWPGLGTKMIRLWDTGTTWRDLEPTNDVWNFQRIDMYVAYVQNNDPQANIIYTMGMTPQWASSTPNTSALYGMGASGTPRDMNDWRDYVRTLARRYAGKIRYWELWNEPDYAPHFTGSAADLVEMARIAREELLAADPNNKLVSPGYTVGQGMVALDAFFAAGGGQYADIIGFHWYYSTNPELIAPSIDNVRTTMKTYNVASKPLWNTEGAFICNATTMNCATAAPTPEESRSVNARAMLIMAAKGVQNFNFYFWESSEAFSKLVEPDLTTPTAAASAMAETRSWLRGASLIDAYRLESKVYVFRLTRGTDTFVILWSTQANTLVNIPAAWGVSKTRNVLGLETPIGTARQLTLGMEPVMLKL